MPPAFLSDLTDGEWARVRAAAFPAHPHPAPLRRAVDALRFRERAWLPWPLLPVGLPPADDLRRQAAAWAADGTWARVVGAAGAAPAPESPPAGPRRRIAGAVRRLPGGRLALASARPLVRLAELARARSAPADPVAGLYESAKARLDAGRFADATDLLGRLLALAPYHAPARIDRGQALALLGRHADARDELLIALTAPGTTPAERARANALLVRVALPLGDPDRAVGHAFLARLLSRFGPEAPWDRDALDPDEADEFELLAEAHNDAAELAINHAGDFPTAAALYTRRDEVAGRYARWLATAPADTLYLSADWVRSIGHLALIDFWEKMRRLGWLGRSRVVVHAPPEGTANRAYLDLLKPLVRVVPAPAGGGGTAHLAAALGCRVATAVQLPGHEPRYFLEAMGAVQEAWERDGRGPLLALTPADRAAGEAVLRAMGVPDGAWFVALHVRSPGFYGESARSPQDHRNADLETYLPLIREVVRRGGWVVRVGDPGMPPLPPTPGAVDYAHSSYKSERADVFLCGACRFFVGVASGLCHLPTTFGVPCLITNWVSNALPVYGGRDLFVPKLVCAATTGRPLPLAETLAPANRNRLVFATAMREAGLGVIDNTPDELRAAVGEMIDRLDGRATTTAADERRWERYAATARAHGLVGFSRVGRDFLRRHEHLLPQSTSTSRPAAVA